MKSIILPLALASSFLLTGCVVSVGGGVIAIMVLM